MESLTDWSSAHQEVEILERDDAGHPKKYTLTPEGDDTRVRFELTVDLTAPLPGFLVRKGAKGLLDTATEGLRQRVLTVKKGG